jgi:hypothetical protein
MLGLQGGPFVQVAKLIATALIKHPDGVHHYCKANKCVLRMVPTGESVWQQDNGSPCVCRVQVQQCVVQGHVRGSGANKRSDHKSFMALDNPPKLLCSYHRTSPDCTRYAVHE